MFEVMFSDELLFYAGAVVFAVSIICFILLRIFFHIKKRKLDGQFETEYGSKIGKDGHPARQEKHKPAGKV